MIVDKHINKADTAALQNRIIKPVQFSFVGKENLLCKKAFINNFA